MSLYLFFDVGNTRLKWAAVESDQNPSVQQKKLWAYSGSISSKSLQSKEHRSELADYISKTLPKPVAIGFCCVAGQEAIANLQSLFPQWHDLEWQQLKGDSGYPGMRSLYQEPSKLGADRWAALIGARVLSNKNTLIVNAGTATTMDLLGSNGVHYGGWILPGLSLMQTSLANNTAQLEVPSRTEIEGFGTCTNDAMIGGCDAAQVGAILYGIHQAKELNLPIEKIWLDGGNAKVLASVIQKTHLPMKQMIEVTEGLVLRGIWAWLRQKT